MRKLERGFTLIEMLIVVAIIAILAGVVLTGVRGFQANARDTRRVGDMRNAQNWLELYFNRCGHYPGAANCAVLNHGGGGAGTSWGTLTTALEGQGITSNVPEPPSGGFDYLYESVGSGTNVNLSYVLGAQLENENNAVIDGLTLPTGHTAISCGNAVNPPTFCATSE